MEKRTDTSAGGQETAMRPAEQAAPAESAKCDAGDRAALDALLHWIEPRRDELVYDFGAAYAILRAAYEKFSEAERERIRSICTAQPYHDDAMRYHDGHYGHVDDARTFELFPD